MAHRTSSISSKLRHCSSSLQEQSRGLNLELNQEQQKIQQLTKKLIFMSS